jgi:hypothetical protein
MVTMPEARSGASPVLSKATNRMYGTCGEAGDRSLFVAPRHLGVSVGGLDYAI